MVFLRIDPHDAVPLGAQIVRGIRLAIAGGRLSPDEQLPSARDLATTLQVNFHTVRKVYAALESDGVVETRRGRGTFVCSGARRLGAKHLREIVRGHVQRLVEDLAGADVAADQIADLVREELRRTMRNAKPNQ